MAVQVKDLLLKYYQAESISLDILKRVVSKYCKTTKSKSIFHKDTLAAFEDLENIATDNEYIFVCMYGNCPYMINYIFVNNADKRIILYATNTASESNFKATLQRIAHDVDTGIIIKLYKNHKSYINSDYEVYVDYDKKLYSVDKICLDYDDITENQLGKFWFEFHVSR